MSWSDRIWGQSCGIWRGGRVGNVGSRTRCGRRGPAQEKIGGVITASSTIWNDWLMPLLLGSGCAAPWAEQNFILSSNLQSARRCTYIYIFQLLKKQGKKVREVLMRSGVTIICLFVEAAAAQQSGYLQPTRATMDCWWTAANRNKNSDFYGTSIACPFFRVFLTSTVYITVIPIVLPFPTFLHVLKSTCLV